MEKHNAYFSESITNCNLSVIRAGSSGENRNLK